MEEKEPERLVAVKKSIVVKCLRSLRQKKIHRLFPGYLCVKKRSKEEESEEGLEVKFKKFFEEYLRVPGGPEGNPYIHAFIEQEPSEHNKWYNKNLAGSYAPSSVRDRSPFRKVVEIEGSHSDITYSLRDEHWSLARKHLAYGKQIPVVELAVVLYRDYALRSFPPSISDLIHVFQSEFGYLDESGEPTPEFKHLYLDESTSGSFENWFAEINGDTA